MWVFLHSIRHTNLEKAPKKAATTFLRGREKERERDVCVASL